MDTSTSSSSINMDSESTESDRETEPSTSDTSAVHTLLDKLKSPSPADINRPRRIKTNKPPVGKHSCRGALTSDPKKVTPRQRVREFDNECLTVSRGSLFWLGCREQLSLKRSVISNHIHSIKHSSSKERLKSKEIRERDLAESLKKHNSLLHPRGETLPEEHQIYRVKVVTTFLKAGVPLNKIDLFKELLEANAFRLTERHSMNDHIPFILKCEEATIQKEINGKYLSVIFDGTSRVGEALAIILRFTND